MRMHAQSTQSKRWGHLTRLSLSGFLSIAMLGCGGDGAVNGQMPNATPQNTNQPGAMNPSLPPGGQPPGGNGPGSMTPTPGPGMTPTPGPGGTPVPGPTGPTASTSEAATACVNLGSCLADTNVNNCFTGMLHLLNVNEIQCLSKIKGNCYAVLECFGLTLSNLGDKKLCDMPNPPRICSVFKPMAGTPIAACQNTAVRGTCDGNDVIYCTTGGSGIRYNCANLIAGTTCKTNGGDAYCAAPSTTVTACQPTNGGETCSGGKLTYCAAGVSQTVDCKEMGYQNCTRTGCRASTSGLDL